jgi:hypothetical protein
VRRIQLLLNPNFEPVADGASR